MTDHHFSRRTMLKGLGLGGGLASLGVPLTACNGGPGGGGGGSDNVSFMTWDTQSGDPLYTMAENWAGSAGKQIDIQSVPYSDYDTKLRTVLASGVPPTVIRVNDDFVKGYYADGQLLDLTPYLEKDKVNPDDYYPVAFNFAKQADGAFAAWPIMTNPGICMINTDAFKQVGLDLPPKDWEDKGWTWDDFLAAATKLTKPGGERWGCLVFPDTACETTFTVNNGSPGIYSEDGTRFTLADKPATDGLQWVADLALTHKVHPDFATVKAGSNTPNWASTQFGNGKIAMMTTLTSSIPYVQKNAKVNWDIVSIPRHVGDRTTINTMTVLAIPKGSKDPDTAWEMLKYAVAPDAAKLFAQSHGFMPVARDAAQYFTPDQNAPQNLGLVSQALDHAVNENFSRYIARARTIYRPVLDSVWSGKQTAAEALGAVQDKVNAVLAGKNT